MPAYPRDELEEMIERWIRTNQRCEEAGDWTPLAEMFTEDATYGWNIGPNTTFMCVGRDEIRELALGQEMFGLDGWEYPYQQILVDEKAGQVVGFWRQLADATRPDGSRYEVAGIGGSWFRYGGSWQWSWQRDWFDLGNATAVFLEMMEAGVLSEGMQKRMDRAASGRLRGYYPRGEEPVPLW